MPEVYLHPDDLTPAQADRVLAFLNRATSAAQLGQEIEFPDEPDIGIRLGQRLLDARAALGGQYTDIRQVRAVRLIGPERFTEVCVAALGISPRRWVDIFFGASPLSPAADTGLVVSLEARPQPAWLGLTLSLRVRVTDRGGVPRAGVQVAVQTAVGQLVWMYGYQRVEGQAVTAITGADGCADLDLARPPSEPPSEVQAAALRTALSALDVHAIDPLKLESDFRALADLYLRERSYNLRRAIDLFVRDHRESTIAALNPGTWRLRWPVDSVLVQADALAPDGSGSSSARAVLTVVWKNWVGAWLEFLGDRLREEAGLDTAFADALAQAKGPEVVGQMLGQAQRFIAGRSGRTALWVGQKTVADAAARLVSSPGLEAASGPVQAALINQLPLASREITPTTLGTYTLATSATRAKGAAIDPKVLSGIEQLAVQVADLSRQNEQLTRQLGGLQDNVGHIRSTLELPPLVATPAAPVAGPVRAPAPARKARRRKPRGPDRS